MPDLDMDEDELREAAEELFELLYAATGRWMMEGSQKLRYNGDEIARRACEQLVDKTCG